MNYLDDFCLITNTKKEAVHEQLTIISILRYLGFFISYKKLQTLTQNIKFLGIYINSLTLEMCLPQDKLEKLKSLLTELKKRRQVQKKQLERLAGTLAHCSKIIRGGRTFSRRVYDLLGKVKRPYHKI